MNCISPPELDDRTLLAYLDDEADPSVLAHLRQCAHCRDKAQRLADLQAHLTAKLYRISCPPSLELGEYHLGMVPAARRAVVAAHLADCPHCTGEIAQLQGYLDELSPSVDPGPLAQIAERVQVLIARLVSGPGSYSISITPAFAGLRGEEDAPLIYQAGDVQVAIEVQPDTDRPGRLAILGLVTGIGPDQPVEAHLWQAGRRLATVTIDELGDLHFPDLSPGNYELILSSPQVEIHVQDLNVGSEPAQD